MTMPNPEPQSQDLRRKLHDLAYNLRDSGKFWAEFDSTLDQLIQIEADKKMLEELKNLYAQAGDLMLERQYIKRRIDTIKAKVKQGGKG